MCMRFAACSRDSIITAASSFWVLGFLVVVGAVAAVAGHQQAPKG